MIKKTGKYCKKQSNRETEVHAGSSWCRTRCKYFNGMLEGKVISCLWNDEEV